jgi:hypothetical protein
MMKRIWGMAIAVGVLLGCAAAQDDPVQVKNQVVRMVANAKVMSLEGAVMGPAVKGAPYAADETRETTQVLGDGTRIHNESTTSVYRDSEGRIRRENPNEITIWDPTTGTNYMLNPKTMTGRKMMLKGVFKTGQAPAGEQANIKEFFYRTMADGAGGGMTTVMVGGPEIASAKAMADFGVGPGKMAPRLVNPNSKTEDLGTQSMEGVDAKGERITSTIETGAIGNDRPIQSVFERWYSPELQVDVMTTRSDPRTGEDIFRLTNIRRGEQSPTLFEVPPGYNILNAK